MTQYCSIHDTHHHHSCQKRFSIRALIGGALVGLGLSFLLSLLGLAIGLIAFSPNNQATSMGIGGYIGILIGTIIATFFSGLVAGRLGARQFLRRSFGIIYGFTTWSLVLGIMIIFAMPGNRYMNSYYTGLANPILMFGTVVTPGNNVNNTQNTTSTQNNNIANSNTNMNNTAPQTLQIAVVNPNNSNTANVGIFAILIFFVFFVGAIASCIGGYVGFSPNRNTRVLPHETTTTTTRTPNDSNFNSGL